MAETDSKRSEEERRGAKRRCRGSLSLELLVLEKRERISVNTANLVVVLTIKIMYHIDEEISVGRCINRNLSEDYKDEKEALYYYTDDSVAMVFP